MNLRFVWLILRKELKAIVNERTILLVILLQLLLALFSSFLMVGLTSMFNPDSVGRSPGTSYRIGYAGNDSQLADLLRENGNFVVYRMDLSGAVAALKDRQLSAVVDVPDTPPNATEPVQISLWVLQNDFQAAGVQVQLKETLLRYEDELRGVRIGRLEKVPVPLDLPGPAGNGDFYLFMYGILVPLLLFMPAIISATLIIDLITEEYQYQTLETLISTPVTVSEVIWGKVSACLLLVPLQACAWLILLRLNGITVLNIPAILLHVTAASLVLILLGALTALFYRERTAAQFIFSIGIIGILFLVVAVPANPLNTVTLLATGAAGAGHWGVFLGLAAAALGLGLVIGWYAPRTVGLNLAG